MVKFPCDWIPISTAHLGTRLHVQLKKMSRTVAAALSCYRLFAPNSFENCTSASTQCFKTRSIRISYLSSAWTLRIAIAYDIFMHYFDGFDGLQ